MDILLKFVDLFLHLDKYLDQAVIDYGLLIYGILFAIIFAETGLVVTPFLPGDSLLFMAGAIAARPGNPMNVFALFALLFVAAFLGDTVNYQVGKAVGHKAFSGQIKWLKKDYLDKTQDFFVRYGGKTIIFARFIPIVRTFAPFVAGIGTMAYSKFISFNVIGAIVWVAVCLAAGYFFGNFEIVKKNFSLVVLGIIVISILPAIVGALRGSAPKAA